MVHGIKSLEDLKYYKVTRKNPVIIKLEKSNKLRFFHYTSDLAASNIIRNECLWITKWNYLDDEKELKYIAIVLRGVRNYLIENKVKYISNHEVTEQVFINIILTLEAIINIYNEGSIPIDGGDIFLLSLTEKKNNKYLIENYSGKSGKIIEINKVGLQNLYIRNKADCLVTEGKVVYDLEEQLNRIIKDINDFHYEIVNNIIFNDYRFDTDELRETIKSLMYAKVINYAIFFKDHEYEDEDEYRIAIIVDSNILKQNIKFREKEKEKRMIKIPYIEVNIDTKYLKVKSAENIKFK